MVTPIFREYIGVEPSLKNLRDFPTEIINSKVSEFHFILGFATETYDKSKKGTGVFKENWNVEFFGPEEVRKLKEKYTNVKVVISIGGCDVNTPFNPAVDEKTWVDAALASLKVIIQKYKGENGNMIDGIDINYENITQISADRANRRFGNHIGSVITALKKDLNLNIKVVSISPSENTDLHYLNLYIANKANIDFINYQFYNKSDSDPIAGDFLQLYKKVAQDYEPAKVIPGINSAEPEGEDEKNKIPKQNFIAGCIQLLQTKSLHGIFVWNAHYSATPPSGGNKAFLLENLFQSLLA